MEIVKCKKFEKEIIEGFVQKKRAVPGPFVFYVI
jgi:hypothetical protein